MCGITGIVGSNDEALVKAMTSDLAHRGPDDLGTFFDDGVGLGHRRLSIIDLDFGKQPISNEDGTIWIVANGEIYNYRTLAESLEKKGHRFKTSSDTEVLVHLYEDVGSDLVKHLNGMFALAIWDGRQKKLLLARDRMGIKPLYYALVNDSIVFASEAKSILRHPDIRREINWKPFHSYLSFRCSHEEETMFRGINKLMPGHRLVFMDGRAEITRYWDFSMLPDNDPSRSEDYYIKATRKLLTDAVKMRLMSEVPLGIYLSGGIDSGSVVALMSRMVEEPIKTLSVGFGLAEHEDELSHARKVAEHFGCDHREITVEPKAADLLPKLVWHMDVPMADPTVIPTYLLSERAKKEVTVVLTGEGADEQFAGYEQYKFMMKGLSIPRPLRGVAAGGIKVLPGGIKKKLFKYSESLGEEGMERASGFLKNLDKPAVAYNCIVSLFSEEEKRELYTRELSGQIGQEGFLEDLRRRFFSDANRGNGAILNSMLYMDTKVALTDDLLMKVDSSTMAFGVEARVPFLDHRLVELSSTIPPALKLCGKTDKYVLRKAMAPFLPEIITNRKKERFFVPIDAWLGEDLKGVAGAILSKDAVKERGFDPDYVAKLFRNYSNSPLFYARQLWCLLIFELWARIFIDSDEVKAPGVGLSGML